MKVTYICSRAFVARPFVNALRQVNVPTEMTVLPRSTTRRFIQTLNIDRNSLIIVDDPYLCPLVLSFLKKMKMLKNGFILRLRGDIFEEIKDARFPACNQVLLDFTFKSANAILHVAKYLERKGRMKYPSIRHFTVYNGVDVKPFSNGYHKDICKQVLTDFGDRIKILTVMNFNIRRKILYFPLLLSTVKRIIAEFPASFFFIGGGKYLHKIKSIFRGQKDVYFLGKLPRNDVLSMMPAFDIFLYPSSLDVLPNAILEASASGLPVISTDVGGISEIVIHNKTGFLMKDIKNDSYRYLRLLIEDEDLRRKISEYGRKWVTTKFDWATITRDFVQIVKSEIERRSQH